MRSWSSPALPTLPGQGPRPRLRDTASANLVQPVHGGGAGIYVCGITPYDSTHMGHAATYLAFDTLIRLWRDAGLVVHYVQNITDVDDPLLERAEETGVPWQDLARSQVELFATDMQALRVLAPDHFIGVVESVDLVASAVHRLIEQGVAYPVPAQDSSNRDGADIYADLGRDRHLGHVGNLDEETMERYFAERGGDPERPGKRHPRDPLLWRAARTGEPQFDGGPLGPGRPGWHIECAAIAERYLGVPFDVQGGGSDLIYPHHEMSTSHLRMLTERREPARIFVHTGLVAYQGHKMSKSRGNLVFVSALLDAGVPGPAIRLVALGEHYSQDWEYTDDRLRVATARWERWRSAVAPAQGSVHDASEEALDVLEHVRAALAQDLDTPAALDLIDAWAEHAADAGVVPAPDAELIRQVADALLGVDLR